jgi:hypothetical protein
MIQGRPSVIVIGAMLCCICGATINGACEEEKPPLMAPNPSVRPKIAIPADAGHLAEDIRSRLSHPGRPFPVKMATGDSQLTYRIGKSISFVVSADRDCYIYVVDVGTDGKPRLLFPNKWQTANKVTKGVECRIPAENADVCYLVEGPKGTNYVKAIATTEPIRFVEENIGRIGWGSPESGDSGSAWANIREELDRMDQNSWSEGELALEVTQ